MSLDPAEVALRLAQLRAEYTFERSVRLRLRELRDLLELTRYLRRASPVVAPGDPAPRRR